MNVWQGADRYDHEQQQFKSKTGRAVADKSEGTA